MSASSLAGSLTGIYFRSCLRSKMNPWVPMVLPWLPCGSLCGCRSGATSDGQNWYLKHVSGHGVGHKNTKIADPRLLQSTRIEVLLFVQLLHLPTKAYGTKIFKLNFKPSILHERKPSILGALLNQRNEGVIKGGFNSLEKAKVMKLHEEVP